MALYSFDAGSLHRASALSYGGYDTGVRFGFTCHRAGHPRVVADRFVLTAAPRTWSDTATTYRWFGAALKKHRATTTRFVGKLPRSKVGVHS